MQRMAHRILVVFMLLAGFSGCSGLERERRSFFSQDGITVGTPARNADGSVFIPIHFETRQVYSAQWLHEVEWSEVAGEILITAVFTVPTGNRQPTAYGGGITLQNPQRAAHKLRYRDPDGKTFPVANVRRLST